MAKFLQRLKSTSGRLFVDPNREQVLADQHRRLEKHLFQDPKGFDLPRLALSYGILPEDLGPIVQRIYYDAAVRTWKDQVVTEKERIALDRIGSLLAISPADRQKLELSIGLDVFEAALADAIADGVLDESVARRLNSIASSLGMTTRTLILDHFADQGESIVRGMFAAIAEDGQIDDGECTVNNATFTFPHVLSGLVWEEQVDKRNTKSITLSLDELRELVRKYYDDMWLGIAYDKTILESWNAAQPNTITFENVEMRTRSKHV